MFNGSTDANLSAHTLPTGQPVHEYIYKMSCNMQCTCTHCTPICLQTSSLLNYSISDYVTLPLCTGLSLSLFLFSSAPARTTDTNEKWKHKSMNSRIERVEARNKNGWEKKEKKKTKETCTCTWTIRFHSFCLRLSMTDEMRQKRGKSDMHTHIAS